MGSHIDIGTVFQESLPEPPKPFKTEDDIITGTYIIFKYIMYSGMNFTKNSKGSTFIWRKIAIPLSD